MRCHQKYTSKCGHLYSKKSLIPGVYCVILGFRRIGWKGAVISLAYQPEHELLSLTLEDAEERLTQISAPLLAWYQTAARSLPWRDAPTPYHVWLSEIMLQQTRVEAVLPYYRRFLEALPDIPALAAAEEEQLHKLWEGLGYYSRVRNLQKAAVQVMERYGGALPASYQLLLELCGIGEYTAGAISSIAFGIPVPAVDGNVLRVLSRILASEADIMKPQIKALYRRLLLDIMPRECPGDFNQALMELGATVCLPNGMPKCAECPLRLSCTAYLQGNPLLYPVKGEKKPRRIEEKTVFVLRSPQGVLLRKRPANGLLAGLWEFPNIVGKLSQNKARAYLQTQGILCHSFVTLPEAKHVFTHVEWQMKGYLAECGTITPKDGEVLAKPEELRQIYTIPHAFSAFKKLLPEQKSV